MTAPLLDRFSFLRALWPDGLRDDERLVAWSKGDGGLWLRRLEDVPPGPDVDLYVGVCLQSAGAELPGARGSASTVTACPGLWLDLDVGQKPKGKKRYPPTLVDARKALARMPHPSTIEVESGGGGLHVYWLFREPWLLASDEERRRASRVVKGWQALLRAILRELGGFDLDSTHDLARVLRLPGTKHSQTEAAAQVVKHDPDARFNPSEIEDDLDLHAARIEIPAKRGNSRESCGPPQAFKLRPDAEVPAALIADLCAMDSEFARVWKRQRPDLPSQSEYDLAIASRLGGMEATPQTIVNAMIQHRREAGIRSKLSYDYYARTLDKAKAGKREGWQERGHALSCAARSLGQSVASSESAPPGAGAVLRPAVNTAGQGEREASRQEPGSVPDTRHEARSVQGNLHPRGEPPVLRVEALGPHPVDAIPASIRTRSDLRAVDSREDRSEASPSRKPQWPAPMHPAAFRGLAGEFVKCVDPRTEASREALLTQFLTGFGSVVDRGPHYFADGAEHHANLDLVLMGSTSGGRKGTSWGHSRRPFALADSNWRTASGLVSGEGLIHQVRDPQEARGKGRPADPGVTDKRLLVVETEFARVLAAMERQGNTLSAVLRQAWESGELAVLAKNVGETATGAHISVIGHITPEELRRTLDRTEVANGLGNRFLWIVTKRSKLLPDGGEPPDLTAIVARIKQLVWDVRKVRRVGRDEQARELWHAVYGELTADRPGLVGELLAREAPQAVRLSLIYALLDGESTIRLPHLEAALAVLDYVRASVRYVFGDSLGDPDADSILRALRANPDGMTREAIRDLFGRHRPASAISRALATLHERGLAHMDREETGGRPAERWRAAPGRAPSDTGGLLRFIRSATRVESDESAESPPSPDLSALTSLSAHGGGTGQAAAGDGWEEL